MRVDHLSRAKNSTEDIPLTPVLTSLAEFEQQHIAVTWHILRTFRVKFPFVTCSLESESDDVIGTDHLDFDEAVEHIAASY